MFFFKKHRVRAKDRKKTINVKETDWFVMKRMSEKVKVPMVQVFHDAMLVYSGFISGVDDQVKEKLIFERDTAIEEWRKDRELLKKYIEEFGEWEWQEDVNRKKK